MTKKKVPFDINQFDCDPIYKIIEHLQEIQKEHGDVVLDVEQYYAGWDRGQDEYFFIPNPYPETNR